jgi:hypothetical protein
MKKAHLLTTAAASLLLTTAAIAADKDQTKDMSNPAPAAQQSAPAEKVAPSMHAGERKAPETTGQATEADDKGKADLKAGDKAKSDMKPAMKSEQKKPETTGQAPKSELNESNDKSSATVKENVETKSAPAAKSGESTTTKSSTTGQGAAAGAANLSTEQRSKITSILKSQKAERANLNISVRVGASVPESVHYYPLPIEVVEVYPEWRGYDFILVGDEILIINPRTHLIVAVLAA